MVRFHPDARFLTDYAAGSLPVSQALCVATHLHYCPGCRLRVGELTELGAELFSLVEQDNRRSLLLDFADVDFLSSAALGKLITLDRKVKSAQGRLKMCNIKPEILEVFQITKLNKVFDIRAGEAEAIAAF